MNELITQEQAKEFTENCTTYQFKLWHTVLPNFDVFRTLCISNDKTYLFIISFIRTILISFLLQINYNYFGEYNNKKYINGILIGYLIINIFITMVVIFKTQKNISN